MPVEEYSKSKFMTQRQRRQKMGRKQSPTSTRDTLIGKIGLIEQMDLPPEKIISISDLNGNLAEGSASESSILKHNAGLQDQINDACPQHSVADQNEKSSDESMVTASEERVSTYQSSSLFREPETTRLDRNRILNDVATEEHVPITQVGGSFDKPVREKNMISSAIQECVASVVHKYADPSKLCSVFAECQTTDGTKKSYSNLVDIKVETLSGSSDQQARLKLKNYKTKSYANCRPVIHADISSKEVSSMKLMTRSIQKNIHKPTGLTRFSKEQTQMKSLSIGEKAKREVNKLKNGDEDSGVSNRCKVSKQERDETSREPIFVKKNFALRKTTKSVMFPAEQKSQSYVKSTIGSLSPRVIKKETSSSSKTIGSSAEPATSSKLDKLVMKSSSPSVSSTGPSGRRNQEKLIKELGKSNVGKQKVFSPVSTSPSTEFKSNRVSNMKLRKHREAISPITVKNQAKSGTSGTSEKGWNAKQPNLENVFTKTFNQKLGKCKLYPDRKGENVEFMFKLSRATEPNLYRQVTHGTYRGVPKSVINSRPGSSSVNSEDNVVVTHKLDLIRDKIANLHSKSNSPKRLKFRLANLVGDNQNGNAADSNSSLEKTRNVVFRHQDVHDKKHAQCFLNQLIEETARELLAARKSRVKALVGAFEIVISFKESKVAPLVAVP
ncbi:hypothetical protein OPV22_000294 [Ensete ventricosum]|uniref:Calmodulin-binding domain-containing protein n=1 Tax=Ensete ventricosum TaxID=4639 RepID=A0AAV8RUG0_ENSVE|nr:hypothetical protein OPV22_000294 [Ensete ventricosum]